MADFTLIKANPTQGEITSSLTGSTGDGAGLHFDGAAGNIAFTPVDLGTKFSFEFVIKSNSFGSTAQHFIDFGNGGRFILASRSDVDSYNLAIFDNSSWVSLGVKVLDDLKVHHLTLTVDGTSAKLYDNGNEVGSATISASHGIDSCTRAKLGCNEDGLGQFISANYYRCRFYNKALTSAEVQTAYERADVDFADQHGSQTETSTNSFVNSGFAGFSGNAAGFTTTGSASNNAVYKNQTFTAGKKYRLKFTIADGNSANLLLLFRSSTGGAGANVGTIESSNLGTVVSNTYLQLEATGNYELILSDLGSAQSIRIYAGGDVGAININSFSIVQIGCVSDYQTQWANPTQSLTVQDASGNADGTCSASGVSQVQPVVQLNSTSARIGTTAATPADGAIVADNVGIGVAPDVKLAIKDNVDNSNESGIRLLRSANSDCGWINMRGGAFNINTRNNAANAGLPVKVKMHGSEVFTIDSSGDVTFTGDGKFTADTNATLTLESTKANVVATDVAGSLNFYTNDGSLPAGGRVCGYVRSIAADPYNRFGLHFGTADFNSTVTDRLVIDNNGNVKIPNTSAADTQLSVECDTTGEAIGDGIRIQNAHGVNNDIAPIYFGVHGGTRRAKAAIGLKRTGSYGIGELRFAVDSNNDDADVSFANDTKLTIDSTGLATFSNGIALQTSPTNDSATANEAYTLDKYETGNFTGSLTAATPPTSVPTATGNYTRIGNQCHFQIKFNSVDTSGASGQMEITGLPFPAANDNDSNYNPINVIFYNLPYSNSNGIIYRNESKIRFYNVVNGAAWNNYNLSAGTGKYLWISGTYKV